MTQDDIIVGRKYISVNGFIYLGAGDRKMWTGSLDNTGEMLSKCLVNITPGRNMGLILKSGDDVMEGVWEAIVPVDI